MNSTKPRGVTIWRFIVQQGLTISAAPGYAYRVSIKSRGRTGARIRSRLARMPYEQQRPILAAWFDGKAAEFPNDQ